MRPILMIERVQNLHDARYCAAIGISMASFNLKAASGNVLTSKMVGEITGWLSGLECVGEFDPDNLVSLEENAAIANLDRILLPFDYALDQVSNLGPPVILDLLQREINPAVMHRMEVILAEVPETLFLLKTKNTQEVSLLQQNPTIIAKCILRAADPNTIYHQLESQAMQPHGFSLGAFTVGEDGHLDYDACDSFISHFEELASV